MNTSLRTYLAPVKEGAGLGLHPDPGHLDEGDHVGGLGQVSHTRVGPHNLTVVVGFPPTGDRGVMSQCPSVCLAQVGLRLSLLIFLSLIFKLSSSSLIQTVFMWSSSEWSQLNLDLSSL